MELTQSYIAEREKLKRPVKEFIKQIIREDKTQLFEGGRTILAPSKHSVWALQVEEAVAVISNEGRAAWLGGGTVAIGVDAGVTEGDDLVVGSLLEAVSLGLELSHAIIPPPAIKASKAMTIYLKAELSLRFDC
jgi:hypothetical protein